MNDKKHGIEDGRSGKDYDPPKKDFLDHIGLGLSDKHIEENKRDYDEGYKIGTSQRVADSNDKKK